METEEAAKEAITQFNGGSFKERLLLLMRPDRQGPRGFKRRQPVRPGGGGGFRKGRKEGTEILINNREKQGCPCFPDVQTKISTTKALFSLHHLKK